jgi:hypothetical protein
MLTFIVGGQRLELVRADERDEVGVGKALVVVDRFVGQSLGAPGEPVADGVLNREAVAGVDAGFELGNVLPELILDDPFGSALRSRRLRSPFPSVSSSMAPVCPFSSG